MIESDRNNCAPNKTSGDTLLTEDSIQRTKVERTKSGSSTATPRSRRGGKKLGGFSGGLASKLSALDGPETKCSDQDTAEGTVDSRDLKDKPRKLRRAKRRPGRE